MNLYRETVSGSIAEWISLISRFFLVKTYSTTCVVQFLSFDSIASLEAVFLVNQTREAWFFIVNQMQYNLCDPIPKRITLMNQIYRATSIVQFPKESL